MTDQSVPAEMPADPMVQVDAAEVSDALLRAVLVMAENAASENSAAECKDYGAAAVSFAGALTTLDPTRLTGGDTPEARLAATPPQMPPTSDGDSDGRIGS